jgi:hypothetical protein
MDQIKFTGGAKVGFLNASWPFAQLLVTQNRLDLHASILGSFAFAPGDIKNIEAVSGFSGSGIRIHHTVEKYKKRIEFQTRKNPQIIIDQIKKTGFFDNQANTIQKEISDKQKQGGFPLKTSAVVVFLTVWNLLILNDFIRFFQASHKVIPLGNGAIIGTASIFLTAFSTNFFPDFRKLILKNGRNVEEIRTFLYFMMFMSGMMFIITNIVHRLL